MLLFVASFGLSAEELEKADNSKGDASAATAELDEKSAPDAKVANQKPDSGKSEPKPGQKKAEAKPEPKEPEQKKPEQKKPGQKEPEQKKPEQKKPGQKEPESKKPGQKEPEQKKPEQKKPEPKAEVKPAMKPGEKDGKTAVKSAGKGKEERPRAAEREVVAMTFASKHHPELAELLANLKGENPAEFQRAMKELSQSAERINRIEDKNPELYLFAVNGWKLDSRIRLLSARLVMADNPAQEAELKALIQQRNELKLRQLKLEREKVSERLKHIEREIAVLEQDQAGAVKRDLQEVRNQLNEKARELKKRGNKAIGEKPAKPAPEKSDKPGKADSEKANPEKANPEETAPDKTKAKKPESSEEST